MNGVLYTESHEGRSAKVYKDTLGISTIAVGFNMQAAGARQLWLAVLPGVDFDAVLSGKQRLTDAQIDALRDECYSRAVSAARRQVPSFDAQAEEVRAVIADMSFQLGESGLSQFKQVRAALAAGNRSLAAQRMLESVWAKQTPRRAAENVELMKPAVDRSPMGRELARKWLGTA